MMKKSILMTPAFALAVTFGVGAAMAQGVPPAPPFQQPAPGAATAQRSEPDAAMRRRMQEYRDARMAMMKAKRAIAMDRRIALVRRALELTPDQQALFKPVEDAMRAISEAPAPAIPAGMGGAPDLSQRLRAQADRLRARADAYGKLADAVGPFRASLNDQQKTRFDVIGRRAIMKGAMKRHGMMRHDMMGHGEGMRHGHMGMMDYSGDGWEGRGWPDHGWYGQGWGGQGWNGPGWGGQGWTGQGWGGAMMGMGGMGGMSGMSGMGGQRFNDMVGMFGMSGWPSYNRVPRTLDGRMNEQGNGWSADQGDAAAAAASPSDDGEAADE